MLPDKRDECGCHKGCVTESHVCQKPCIWPSCLTKDEESELLEELRDDSESVIKPLTDYDLYLLGKYEEKEILDNNKYLDRYVKCYACKELHSPEYVAEHEFAPGKVSMFCDPCAKVLELDKGK